MDSNVDRSRNDADTRGGEMSADSNSDAFVETMSEAFDDVFEFGPTVETSSRPIDQEVAAARETQAGATDDAVTASTDDSVSAVAISGGSTDESEGQKDRPRTIVSERGVEEVFDTLEEHSDPPW